LKVAVAVQFRVINESAYEAYYRLTDPRGQIQSYVFDVVRSTVPKLELDEAFASKDEIAAAVLHQLQSQMKEFGYEIRNTLVTDMSPDARVKASMNEINASKYGGAFDEPGDFFETDHAHWCLTLPYASMLAGDSRKRQLTKLKARKSSTSRD
jgi:hypothetical protein